MGIKIAKIHIVCHHHITLVKSFILPLIVQASVHVGNHASPVAAGNAEEAAQDSAGSSGGTQEHPAGPDRAGGQVLRGGEFYIYTSTESFMKHIISCAFIILEIIPHNNLQNNPKLVAF